MGIVDFNVLDGVDENIDACEITNVHGTAGIEIRVFVPQFRHREINSPGEPGVSYYMGTGFTSSHIPDLAVPALVDIRKRAADRNRQVLERINAFLVPLSIDYEEEILPQLNSFEALKGPLTS